MNKINYYEKKYYALESFYGWVDSGSSYDIAVDQANYYDHHTEKIDIVLKNITMATRFTRSGREFSNTFKNELKDIIATAKQLDLDEYGLTDEEKEVYYEEFRIPKGVCIRHKEGNTGDYYFILPNGNITKYWPEGISSFCRIGTHLYYSIGNTLYAEEFE